MLNIGDNIRIARKRKGLTQEELASQIGVVPQAVSRWESGAGVPDISLNKCKYLEAELNKDSGNFVVAMCLVESTADLSRYADFENYQCDWDIRKNKAISAGMQVIRFCSQKMLLERTHYALAWIYIHEKDFASAREHIEHLPSVKENRLQESILAQVASFEHGVEGMKAVMRGNLQNMVRVINKEILYAMEDISWADTPENAVEFATWGLGLMEQFCKKKELIPYCRGRISPPHYYVWKRL